MEHEFMKFKSESEVSQNVFWQRLGELFRRLFLVTRLLWPFKSSSKVEQELEKPIVIIIPPINAYSFFSAKLTQFFELKGYYALKFKPVGLFSGHRKQAAHLEDYILQNNLKNCQIIGIGSGAFLPLLMGYKGRDRISTLITILAPFGGRNYTLFPFLSSIFELRPTSKLLLGVKEQARTFANIHSVFFNEKDRLGRHDDIQLTESGVYQIGSSEVLLECLEHII